MRERGWIKLVGLYNRMLTHGGSEACLAAL
jgi:hypothetical protein